MVSSVVSTRFEPDNCTIYRLYSAAQFLVQLRRPFSARFERKEARAREHGQIGEQDISWTFPHQKSQYYYSKVKAA